MHIIRATKMHLKPIEIIVLITFIDQGLNKIKQIASRKITLCIAIVYLKVYKDNDRLWRFANSHVFTRATKSMAGSVNSINSNI